MPFYEIVVLVKEQRTYLIEAASRDDAEARALEGDEEQRGVDVLDEWVVDCLDVTEDCRDYDHHEG